MKRRARKVILRPVYENELPTLWDEMRKEGIWFQLTRTGYQFYVGEYKVSNRAVCEVWGISRTVLYRIAKWLMTMPEERYVLVGDNEWV